MRNIKESDLEPLRIMHNDPSTLYNLTDTTFVSANMQKEWYKGIDRTHSKRYVIDDKNGLVSFVRIDEINLVNKNACIGLDIMVERRGKGFGKKCYSLLFKYLFDELNMNMLWLYTAEFNKVGLSLYNKVGMQKCGTLPQMLYRDGEYHSCTVMHITKEMWENVRR